MVHSSWRRGGELSALLHTLHLAAYEHGFKDFSAAAPRTAHLAAYEHECDEGEVWMPTQDHPLGSL